MQRLRLLRSERESGQVATVLVVGAVLAALFLLVAALLPLAGASDQRSRAQTAADAAALAGVQGLGEQFRDLLAGGLRDEGALADWLSCGLGREGAQAYAARNGADVTDYCYRRPSDRVVVEVQMRDPLPTGDRAQARAAATMKLPLGRCRFASRPVLPSPPALPSLPPLSTRAPAPSLPPVSPPPLPDLPLVARCGSYELHFLLPGDGGPLRYVGRNLDDLLEPRLVSSRGSDV